MKQFDLDKAREYLVEHLNTYYKHIQETDDRESIQSSRLAFMTTVTIGKELGILRFDDLLEYNVAVLFKMGKEKSYD